MKILPVSNNNVNRTFNGLWRSPEASFTGNEYVSLKTINKFYYPFLDEIPAHIDIIKKQNTQSRVVDNHYQDIITYVQDKLPFTESDYISYKLLGEEQISHPTIANKVERALQDRGLVEYINGFETKYNQGLNLLQRISRKIIR